MKRRTLTLSAGLVILTIIFLSFWGQASRPTSALQFFEDKPATSGLAYVANSSQLVTERVYSLSESDRRALIRALDGGESAPDIRSLTDGSTVYSVETPPSRVTLRIFQRGGADELRPWRVVMAATRPMSPLDRLARWWRRTTGRPYP